MTTPTNVSKTGTAGRSLRRVPPTFRNVLMNGFGQVLRRSDPKAPNNDDCQSPMLTIIAPPQIKATMLMIVPQLPSENQAPLWGQPFVRAANTPRLHRK